MYLYLSMLFLLFLDTTHFALAMFNTHKQSSSKTAKAKCVVSKNSSNNIDRDR